MDEAVRIGIKGGRRVMFEAGYGCWDTSKHSSTYRQQTFLFYSKKTRLDIPKHPIRLSSIFPKRPHRRVNQQHARSTDPAACFQISLMRGLLSNSTSPCHRIAGPRRRDYTEIDPIFKAVSIFPPFLFLFYFLSLGSLLLMTWCL